MANIREIMTANPVTLLDSASVTEAARKMRDSDIGDVIVCEQSGRLCGIVTDRDLVVRVLADRKDPGKTALKTVCSRVLTTVSPNDRPEDAVKLMREKAFRRLPVVEQDKVVGVVSLGDLAIHMDRSSALAEMSAATANR